MGGLLVAPLLRAVPGLGISPGGAKAGGLAVPSIQTQSAALTLERRPGKARSATSKARYLAAAKFGWVWCR